MNITLGTSTVSTLTGYVSGFLNDFSGYITLILGIIAGVFVIGSIIEFILPSQQKKHFDSEGL